MRYSMLISLIGLAAVAAAQDKVFSGPQPGEKVNPFKALGIGGSQAGKEYEVLKAEASGPVVVVFIHNVERSILPLLRIVDVYSAKRGDALKATFVFLSDDKLAMENRLPTVVKAMNLKSDSAFSLDGGEGPGSYGLNKKCLVTIVAAKDGKATANFALVQPGIADAPKVLEALAKTSGDQNPPTVEELQASFMQGRPQGGMRPNQQLDLDKLDTSSPEAMKRTIELLIAEVKRLRGQAGAAAGPTPGGAGQQLPGKAPTDPEMVNLLRAAIQKSNMEADVDRALKAMEDRFKDSADLRKQAVDGLIRVVYLKYGTEYFQKAAQSFIDKHKGA